MNDAPSDANAGREGGRRQAWWDGQPAPGDVKPAPVEGDPAAPAVHPDIASALDNLANPKRSWTQNLVVLAISVVLFFSLGLWDEPLPSILVIMGALLVHEMGHLVMMKLLGYSDVQIFFIPFLGAAVSGRNVRAPGWKRAVVTLAGPLTGLAGAFSLFVAWMHVDSTHLAKAAIVFVFLNIFNLLPLYPLDGGRFLQETLFCRNRYLEAVFRVLMGGLTILCAVFMSSWFLGLIGVFVVLNTGQVFKIGATAADLRARRDFPDAVDPREADARVICETQIALQKRFEGVFPAAIEAKRIWDVWEKLNARPPGALAALGLLGVYFMTFVMTPVAPLAYYFLSVQETEVERIGPDGTPIRVIESRTGRILLSERSLDAEGLYHGEIRDFLFGKPMETTRWRHGWPHGEWTGYDADGKPGVVLVFDEGAFVVRRVHSPSGVNEWKRDELPSSYRALVDAAESKGPYGPDNLFGLSPQLMSESWPDWRE